MTMHEQQYANRNDSKTRNKYFLDIHYIAKSRIQFKHEYTYRKDSITHTARHRPFSPKRYLHKTSTNSSEAASKLRHLVIVIHLENSI